MTYPPQPGTGGDPYGQGRQPGSGGVPQQPGWDPNVQPGAGGMPPQQPGWDPNAQQYPPTQQYGQPYGQQPYPGTQQFPQQGWDPNQQQYGQGGPPPPKGNKTGLWIGIAVAVVVVVAVGITGFVAPGFFLSKDSNNDNTAQTQAPPPAPSSQQQPLPSTGSSPSTDESNQPGTGGSSADSKGVIDGFISKINAKDASGAIAMTCRGTESFSKDSIDEATGGEPNLTVKGYDGSLTVTANLKGTLSGKTANGSVIATQTGGKWCVGFFFVLAY